MVINCTFLTSSFFCRSSAQSYLKRSVCTLYTVVSSRMTIAVVNYIVSWPQHHLDRFWARSTGQVCSSCQRGMKTHYFEFIPDRLNSWRWEERTSSRRFQKILFVGGSGANCIRDYNVIKEWFELTGACSLKMTGASGRGRGKTVEIIHSRIYGGWNHGDPYVSLCMRQKRKWATILCSCIALHRR